jgi:hypothetical protein
MARKKGKARPGGIGDMPQRFDVWQVDVRQMGALVREGERSVRPWIVIAVSATEDVVLFFELIADEPGPDEVQEVLVKAVTEPADGEPHRPTAIQFGDEVLAEALRIWLEAVEVGCEVVENLDRVDEVVNELTAQLPTFERGVPGLLEMPGVTPDSAGSFFDAAALYFEHAPWKKTGERPVRINTPRFESGPWYAIMMGQAGMTRGLVLYDNLETLQRIQQSDCSQEENARLTAALAVVFGEEEDLLDVDVEAIKTHGWRVAARDAYPTVYRMDPGMVMRPPLAWELDLLEGCMRALPEFVRKKTRRTEPMTLAVPLTSGDLPLELAWEE